MMPNRRIGGVKPALTCDNAHNATSIPPHPVRRRTGGVAGPKSLTRRPDTVSIQPPTPPAYPGGP